MDEATLLAEQLDLVKNSNKILEEDLREYKIQCIALRRRLAAKDFFRFVLAVTVGLGILTGLGWLSLKGLNSYDTNQCYIKSGEQRVNVYEVYRKVEWATDKKVGFSTDLDKAMEIVRKQGCKAPRKVEQ